MNWRLNKTLFGLRRWWPWAPQLKPEVIPKGAAPKWHVIVLDGTLSSFERGRETNAGQLAKLLSKSRPEVYVYYEPGLQFNGWRSVWSLLTGKGIGDQIQRAFGVLSSRYDPGDKIVLAGYSRGAFAVRSLSGMIDRVGLLKPEHATERMVELAWSHYRRLMSEETLQDFRDEYCLTDITIEAVGVWDTVRALGLPYVNKVYKDPYAFHSYDIAECVSSGFHAMALNESRLAYNLEKWNASTRPDKELRQVWFRGVHGDVGGHLSGFEAARPLSNIPFIWVVENLEAKGLPCPENWQDRFQTDPKAPSLGIWRGWGRFLPIRKRRMVNLKAGEEIHTSVAKEMYLKQL